MMSNQQIITALGPNSPTQTRARTRQLHVAAVAGHADVPVTEGVFIPATQIYVPLTSNVTSSPNDTPKEITTATTTHSHTSSPSHSSATVSVETTSSPNEQDFTERRFIHLGPMIHQPNMQQQIEDLQNQVRYLSSVYQQPSNTTSSPSMSAATPIISVVSKEQAFPTPPPPPRTYLEGEKLKGRDNYTA